MLGVTGSLPLLCSQSEDKTHHSIQAPNTKLPSESDPLHYPRRSHGAQGVTCQSKMSPKCVLGPISSQSSFCCQDGVLRSTWGWHSLLSGWPQFAHNSKPLAPNCVPQEDTPSIREMSCGEHPESRDPRGQSQEIFPLRTPQPVGGSFATSWFLKLTFGGNGQKSTWFKWTSIVGGVLIKVGRTSLEGAIWQHI